jgi:succinate-semialdehyde dehydrogenase/glutarate-semialdehyde dehydrogenase
MRGHVEESVHESVLQPFSKLLGEKVSGLRVGRGTDESTEIGPLINAAAILFAPTIVSGVSSKMRMFHEETFGPVIPLSTFCNEASGYGREGSKYGLVE